MYPECAAFLRKNMRVREIVILAHLSHSHGFAQKRNAFGYMGGHPKSDNIIRDRILETMTRILEMCDNSRMR